MPASISHPGHRLRPQQTARSTRDGARARAESFYYNRTRCRKNACGGGLRNRRSLRVRSTRGEAFRRSGTRYCKKSACGEGFRSAKSDFANGRAGGTRTRDLLTPSQARYQTAPRPVERLGLAHVPTPCLRLPGPPPFPQQIDAHPPAAHPRTSRVSDPPIRSNFEIVLDRTPHPILAARFILQRSRPCISRRFKPRGSYLVNAPRHAP